MRAGILKSIAAGGAVGLCCLTASVAHAATPTPAPAPSTIYGVSSVDPPQKTTKLSALQKSAADGRAVMTSAGPGAFQPMTATPSGYKLLNPGYKVSDYIYQSDSWYESAFSCDSNDNCTTIGASKVSLRESVRGGSSKYWDLTASVAPYGGYPMNFNSTYSAIYYCGVNVSGATDHTCGNGADPSGTSDTVYQNDGPFARKFENVSGNIVFPMVGISTHFSNGVTVITKFRGYDVKNTSSSTKLNSSSGSGD